MKITVTGSLGNVGRPLVEKLVANGHEVKVISANAGKAPEIEQLNAIPLIGSLEDPAFVSSSFRDADAVYTMTPPDFFVPDYYGFAGRIHQNYVRAIEQNGIQHVVNLSSIGMARADSELLAMYYNPEAKLNAIPRLNIVHLRPAMFYTNFYGSLPLVQQQGIIGHNVGEAVNLLMTHPADIAATAFTFLSTLSFKGRQVEYVISDIKNGAEIARVFGEAIGKPVHWAEFPDEDLLAGLMQNGFSKDTAGTYIVAAGKAIRDGLFKEFEESKYQLAGSRKFVDFAREFANVYRLSNG